MSKARFFIAFILVAIILASFFLLWSSRTWKPSSALENMLPKDIDMRINNLTLSEAGAKDRTMTITAASAKFIKSQDIFILEKIKANIKTNENSYVITADGGSFKQKESLIVLMGQVNAVDQEARILKSDKIELDLAKGFLESKGKFTLIGPEIKLSGESFSINTETKILTAKGRVNLLIND